MAFSPLVHKNWATKAGSEITKDMSGGILQDITKGASILGMLSWLFWLKGIY